MILTSSKILQDAISARRLEKGKDENRLSVSERFVLIMLHDIITEIEKTAEERGVDLHSVSYGMKEDL